MRDVAERRARDGPPGVLVGGGELQLGVGMDSQQRDQFLPGVPGRAIDAHGDRIRHDDVFRSGCMRVLLTQQKTPGLCSGPGVKCAFKAD